jgi:hypothetical protein
MPVAQRSVLVSSSAEIGDRRAMVAGVGGLSLGGPVSQVNAYGGSPAEFTLPDSKSMSAGSGRLVLPEGRLMPGGVVASTAVLHAATAAPLPSVPHAAPPITLTSAPTPANCRIQLPSSSSVELPALVADISSLLTSLRCDFDLTNATLRWSTVSSLDCSYTRFTVTLLSDDNGGYVLDVYRKEGSAVTFRRIYNHLHSAFTNYPNNFGAFLQTLPALLVTTKALPSDVIAGRVIDASTLKPLVEMSRSNVIDQQLYSAQVTARLVTTPNFSKAMMEHTDLLKSLICLVDGNDTTCNDTTKNPFYHAIARHVCYVLASLSEDITTHSEIIDNGGLAVCFKIVTGVVTSPPTPASSSTSECCKDVSSRREACRCLQILLSDDDNRNVCIKTLDCFEGWREVWKGFREVVKDGILKARVEQIEKYFC